MKILYLGQSLNEHAGWGRYSWEIVSRVKKQHEVQILVEEGSDKPGEVAILKKPKSFLSLLANLRIVKKLAAKFDIVHALDGYPYGWYAAITKKPFFINGIGTYSVAPLESLAKAYFLKKAYARAVKIFCISEFTKLEIEKRVKLSNLEVVHLGADQGKFYDQKNARDNFLIVGVGALKSRKGYHVALQAVARLVKEFPELHYVVVGRADVDSYTQSLRKFVQDNHLEKNVEFLGELSDEQLVSLYNRAKLFLLLPVNHGNHFEGFGLVYLEAALCGLPVVGTGGNGGEDAVSAGHNGFLVAQNDPAAAVAAAAKLLSDPPLWQDFSASGEVFARQFTWEKTVSTYLKAYESAISPN